ncbi:hypothetical protein SBV1_30045 [Verrucomicrobia bacterium]|nr:hypothetical protein SBV1_30045 [Verrucomicrobiota bacterium]
MKIKLAPARVTAEDEGIEPNGSAQGRFGVWQSLELPEISNLACSRNLMGSPAESI